MCHSRPHVRRPANPISVRYSNRAAALGILVLLTQAACGKGGDASTTGNPAAKGGPGGPGGGPPAVVLGPSDVMEVTVGTIEAGIAISGDLKPIEEVVVRARVEGDVVAVLAREGDRVGRGQLLVRFEDAVQEGDRVSATADRESAKADVANAQWNAEQSEELFKAGAIPERDVRAAQQALSAAQARLAAAEARLRATSQTASDTRIVSPTYGVIATREVELGERVQRGATLFTVVRNDVLELEASVPARQAGELKIGQPVRFSAGGRTIEGKVARIAPTINAASRTILVYLQVPNRDGELKGNAFVTGRIVGRTVEGAVVIPTAAVRQSAQPGETFVYRIEGDRVQHVLVQVGITDDVAATAQIVEGLAAGDRIIVGNVGAVGRGTQVRIVSPEQRQRGAGTGGAGQGSSGMNAGESAPATGRVAPATVGTSR